MKAAMKVVVAVCSIALGLVAGVAESALLGDAFPISTASGVQTWSDVSFDSTTGRFLVTWSDRRNLATGYDVYAQLLNPDGTLFGPEIFIAGSGGDEKRPTGRYSPTSNRFMVVWPDTRNQATSGIDMYGQVIDDDGTLIGPNFPVSTAIRDQFRPAMAYDPVNDRFVATWQDGRNVRLDVFAQIIDPDGMLVGGNVGISTVTGANEDRPRIAYDSTRQRFFFVWVDFRNASTSLGDIFGQFVGLDLGLIGSAFPMSTAPGDQFRAAVGYDADDDVYLVSWIDCRNNLTICREGRDPGTDIYARMVRGDGTMAGDEIPITTDPNPQYRPAIGYSPVDRLFLLTWTDERNVATSGVDTYHAAINPDGTLLGPIGPATLATGDQHRSAVTYDSLTNRMLVVFSSLPAPGAFDLMGQFISLSGTVAEASITATGGTPQSTTISTAFAAALEATVADSGGNPVSGKVVTFAAPGAGASASLSSTTATTDASGIASVTATANTSAGSYTVTASAPGVATPASFALTNTVAAAASITATGGTPQSTTISTAFAAALQATVKDSGSNPVSGVVVTFAAPGAGASASLSSTTATTNASGIASVTATANASTGSYTVTASAPGVATPASFALTNTASTASAEFIISAAPGEEDVPTVAYSSATDSFLAAWVDSRTKAVTDLDLYMQVIDGDGSLQGGNLVLSDAANVQKIPTIGYSALHNHYLVAWSDRRHTTSFDNNLLGRLVNPDGTFKGGEFTISDARGDQGGPGIAGNAAGDLFLIVWADNRIRTNGFDIYGQLLAGDGMLIGSNFRITFDVTDQFRPSIAYSEAHGLFMVTWTDCLQSPGTCTRATEVGTMVYAQLIDTVGSFVGGAFAVTDVVADHSQPNVAYNTIDDRIVVVWEDGRNIAVSNRDIFGQVLGGDGSLIGGNFPIATAPEQQTRPVIAHSPVDNQFLVVWSDDRNILTTSKDLYGQALNGTGSLLGVNFPISTAPVGQIRPTVAHNPVTNQFLVIWADTRVSMGDDIYGRLVTLSP